MSSDSTRTAGVRRGLFGGMLGTPPASIRCFAALAVLALAGWGGLRAEEDTPMEADESDAAAVAASDGQVVREGGTLHISTAHGVVSLRNDDSDLSEDYHIYRYEGHLAGTPFHAIHISYFESPGYLLVHEKSGRQSTVDARPVVSPSGKFLAVGSLDLEAMMSPNVLTIHEVSGDSLLAVWTDEPMDWGPEELHWLDETTLQLTRVVATDRGPGEYDRVPARLVHTDSEWLLSDLPGR